MVFPVFGRGRALFPLVGAGITPKNIRDAAEFLAGPCSCEVKEQNPGFDLLLKADWRDLLGQATDSALPSQTENPAEPELVAIPAGSETIEVHAAPPNNVLTAPVSQTQTVAAVASWPIVGGAIFLLLMAATGLIVLVQGVTRRSS
jgi:hypothetical protein